MTRHAVERRARGLGSTRASERGGVRHWARVRSWMGILAGASVVTGCTLLTPLDGLSDGLRPNDEQEGSTGTDAAADAPTDAGIEPDSFVPDAATGPIRWRDTVTLPVSSSANATSFAVNRPAGTAAADVLVGVVALGRSGNSTLPVFTPPSGWTLVRRVDHTEATSLIVYVRVAASAEPAQYTWTSDLPVEGYVLVSAYAGVDITTPVDTDLGVEPAGGATQYSTATITTSVPLAVVIAAFAGHAQSTTDWQGPPGMSRRAGGSASTRSVVFADRLELAAGVSGPFTATASPSQDYVLTELLALRPAR